MKNNGIDWQRPESKLVKYRTQTHLDIDEPRAEALNSARAAIYGKLTMEITDNETGELYFQTKKGNVEYIERDFALDLYNIHSLHFVVLLRRRVTRCGRRT